MATSVSGPAATPLRLFSSSSSAAAAAAARSLTSSCGCLRPARAVVPPPAPRRERWRPHLAPVPGVRPALLCAAVRTIEQGQFSDEVLGSDLPVLVEFVAGWCGPCRLIGPVVEWVSKEYEGKLKVVKIDHDANPQLIEEYKVYGLPALVLFKKGQEVPGSRREGAITKVKLKEYLDSLLESTTTVG